MHHEMMWSFGKIFYIELLIVSMTAVKAFQGTHYRKYGLSAHTFYCPETFPVLPMAVIICVRFAWSPQQLSSLGDLSPV
ncbi:hypothetical protein TNCV_1831421 [Trichonephila clavipes]|nr:hypothetical protein TNCV_1831421 [Trichonephila clavipes]